MPKLELSRVRARKAGVRRDDGDQASKTWQALLGPFSHRPGGPPRRRPAKTRAR